MEWQQSISKEIFEKKYMINGEQSPDDVFLGVAKEIASVEAGHKNKEKWASRFYDIISSGKLIPAGRILANARPNAKMPYYNNCYTIAVDDSIDGIYDSLKEDAQISRTGGGVGINFSNLRPKNAPLRRGGVSSGSISFMKVFNESAKIIQTGGSRRSAHIGILNIDHPDIEEFITAKRGDSNKVLTQFNISVGITDKFMEAVKNDAPWDLVFEGKIYKTVKAKYLYELMTKNAYEHNEPGILNLDTINKYNNGYYDFSIQEVNPCFTGDTIIAVADGRNGVSIKELADENKKIPVYSGRLKGQGWRHNNSKWKPEIKEAIAFKTGERKVIDVILSNGSSFKCTPDHLLAKPDGSYIEAAHSVGEELENFYTFSNKMTANSYRTIKSKTNGYNRQYRMIWEYKNGSYDGKEFNVDHIDNNSTNDELSNLKLVSIEEHKLKTSKHREGNNPLSRMKDKERFNILQRQKNILGNAKRYDWTDEKIEEELNKIPQLKPAEDENVYMDERVFVKEIRELGVESVYDLTVEDNHNFYILTQRDDDNFLNSSGVLVHNCGEIVMPPYSLCCLSSLNLPKFVVNPFTPEADFDWQSFAYAVRIGIRFLDNVLDATKYPLQKIKDVSKKWRRVGLGFTGLGDMLAMMGVIYGSEDSKKEANFIGKLLRDESYKASIELAREKGRFPSCDRKKLVESEFIKQLPEPIIKDIRKYGLRNIALNTTAPTGTTSLSVGQNCSSGIEPIFSLDYDRNIRTGDGDETKKEKVYDYAWLKYLDFKGIEGLNNLKHEDYPKAFVTTFDINVFDAIDIQAIFQKYIDHSISKTLNLPAGTTYEEYSKLFKYAYDNGLKGFTSFNPEGSMKGILETPSSKQDDSLEIDDVGVVKNSSKRPKELPCDIHELTYKGEKYIALIGLMSNNPYEMFVTKNTDKEFDFKKHKAGIIKKVKKGQYSLFLTNGEEKCYIENIGESFDSVYGSLSRFISMSLRHHVPLQFVVDQLVKDKNFMGFERVVSRVLKKYIAEGEKVKTSEICPECGNDDLRYQEGCLSCTCGWSKCS